MTVTLALPGHTFLGYIARRPWKEDAVLWVKPHAPHVREIVSAADCSTGPLRPAKWIDRWDFNRASVYDSPDIAWATIPDDDPNYYDLYAYWIRTEHPLATFFDERLPPLPEQPGEMPDGEILGYDIIAGSPPQAIGIGCSILFCNQWVEHARVNEFALIDREEDVDAAIVAMERAGNCEPGPYYGLLIARLPSPRSAKRSQDAR